MDIVMQNVSKSFNGRNILNNYSQTFSSGVSYAITGPNGSGKSTLLHLLTGFYLAHAGQIIHSINGVEVASEEAYQSISFTAPYLSLEGDFTLMELIENHFSFKLLSEPVKKENVLELLLFDKSDSDLLFKNCSSGMQQRMKLGLAILSKSEVLVLDEPFTNLDKAGKIWCKDLIGRHLGSKMLIIGSNEEEEIALCQEKIALC